MNKLEPLLQMKNITKSFPGIQALDDVCFDLYPGEVHVLVGENGAGKSTLMKVLAGAYERDAGEIYLDGELQTRWNPTIATEKGVAMVYQEFTLLPYRNVAENIFLGREKTRNGLFLDKKRMHREAAEGLEKIGVNVNTHSDIISLGVADQQMIEIVKALSMDAKILVLDEPTSALSLREIEQLFKCICILKDHGVGVIYISHRLEEIKQLGDRVTVMRDGQLIGTRSVSEMELDEIIQMMVGREIKELYPRHYTEPGDLVLKVRNIRSGKKVKNASLDLRYGEIVGLSGLVGSGRTETARAIFGLDSIESGSVEFMGKMHTHMKPPKAVDMGMGMVPEDRRGDGLFPILSMRQNLIMASLRRFFPHGLLSLKKEKEIADQYVKKFNIQPPGVDKLVQFLSGGNQQKVVLGKWLAANPRVIIIDEPTRGIDVGAKSEVHALMDQLANAGNAILMISSELPEILGMSDRIYVMHEGSVAGEFSRGVSSEEILRCAMGVN